MKASYKCSEDELYQVCQIILVSLREELGAFAVFKAKYTTGFADGVEDEIKAAMALASNNQRAVKHEIPRINLNSRHKQCLKKLQALRLYIKEAFKDKDMQRARLKEAGFNDYHLALRKDWEKVIAIMRHGTQFIAGNRTDLQANDNMPVGFEAAFIADEIDLKNRVVTFEHMRAKTLEGTLEKVKANNALYKTFIRICGDGRFVFRDNAAKREQFIFNRVMELVTPRNAGRLKFDVKEAGTNLPLAGMELVIQQEGDVALVCMTDKKGRGVFEGLSAGVYKVRAGLNGFAELEVEVVMRKGVRSFKHWVMEKK